MTTAIDDVFVEDKDIVVGTDSRGHSMTVLNTATMSMWPNY